MSEYFFLIPLSLVLGITGLGVFLWTLKAGQYEDLQGAAERVLFDEEPRSDAVEARRTENGQTN